MTAGRLPYAPLERLLRASHDAPDWSDSVAARRLDVTKRSISRYKANGLDPWAADRLARAAHHHPLDIWGDAWTAACAADEDARGWANGKRARQWWRWPDGRREPCEEVA